jgi:nitric oxide reductase subunit B
MSDQKLKDGERITLVLMACALACLLLSILVGGLGALYYLPPLARVAQGFGLSLVELRPLHTTFASSWLFLGVAACVTYFLFETEGPTAAEKKRTKVQLVCWGLAGLGALVTLPFGITTGREYLGFSPFISLLIYTGWILFAITFFSRVWHGFWARPVYVYMWAGGILFFLYTFAEGHAYLLPGMEKHPIADMQVQWKSCGTLVASFNQMVYGSLIFVGEKLSGDKRAGHSKTSFALFGVGLLNSFTNYVHHTYHLPQAHLVKWVAFYVSMLEIILLVLVFREVTLMMRKRPQSSLEFNTTAHFIGLSKCWNLGLLTLALLISVPPLNALIHGTHVVMAHAMGSELAIDSYILFAVFAYLLSSIFPKREVQRQFINTPQVRHIARLLNTALVALILWLLVRGLAVGITRYLGQREPAWLDQFPYVFAVLGFAVGTMLVRLILNWVPLFVRPERHKHWA